MKINKAFIKEVIKIVGVLVLIATISGIILGFVKPITEINQVKVYKDSISAMLAETYPKEKVNFEEITLLENTFDTGKKKVYEEMVKENKSQVLSVAHVKKLDAYIFQTIGKGAFNDKIVLFVLIESGKIKKIKVSEAKETAGLGTKALKDNHFKKYYDIDLNKIKNVDDNKKSKDGIAAITGATKTSNAVLNAVNGAKRVYMKLTGGVE